MDVLISGTTVLTMDADLRVIQNAFVGITDGKISHVGKAAPPEKPKKIIDATGLVLMPGLIDAHTHITHSILRNYRDDLPPLQRLEQALLPRCDKMDKRTARAAAVLSVAEALRSGTTSFSALEHFGGTVAQVAAEAGIKCNIAPAAEGFEETFDFERSLSGQQLEHMNRQWNKFENGRIHIDAGLFSEYTSRYPMWEAFGEYAASNDLGVHLHLAQTQEEVDSCKQTYGLSPVQLLDCHHLFGKQVTAAGCGCLDPEDLPILARHGTTAVYTPVSACKQGMPATDVTKLIQAGINVALGSDGAAYGAKLDLFSQMRAAALTTSLPPAALLTMATVCGAKAQGRADSCGQIKLGMDADLILLDFTAPHLIPCHNLLSQLVYCADGQDVCMTMVRGNIVYAGGKFPTLDLASAVGELTQYGVATMFSDAPPAAKRPPFETERTEPIDE